MIIIQKFALGGLFGLAAILGLVLASAHNAGAGYWFGILIFLVSIGLIFAQISEAAFLPGRASAHSGLPLPPIVRNFARIRSKGARTMNAMNTIEKFVIGGVLGLFAIVSLFVASRHGEGASYWGGLAFFAICIGLIFYQLTLAKYGTDESSH